MRIFLFYAADISIQQRFKLDLMDCCTRNFGTLKGSITVCDLISTGDVCVSNTRYDYFCVVEDSTNDLNQFKETFDKELNSILSKHLNRVIVGDSLVTRNFNLQEFENNLNQNH